MSYVVPSESYLIKTPADFPAPVGGVIDLPEERIIIVDKQDSAGLVVPPGVQLRVPTSSVLRGWDSDANGLQGDVDAPLIIGEGDGIVVTNLFLRNFNAGVNAFCVEVTNGFNPLGRASRIDDVSLGGSGGLLIEDATAVQVSQALSRCTRQGYVFRGQNGGVQLLNCNTVPPPGTTPTHITFDGGEHSAIRIAGNTLVLIAGVVGVDCINDPQLSLWALRNTEFVPQAPGGTPFQGAIDTGSGIVPFGPDAQTDVLFLDNFGIAESSFSGAAIIPSNGTENTGTQAAGQGVFVPVGSGNVNHPLYQAQNPTSRFVVIDPVDPGAPQAQRQRLVWTGPEPVTFDVEATASINNGNPAGPFPSNIFQLLASMRIMFQQDVLGGGPITAQQEFDTTLADGFSGEGAVGEVSAKAPRITFNPGDGVFVEIANKTDNPPNNPLVDLRVTSISLSFS